jgi:Ricin-type beta-trefoil lectin domain-like
MKKVHYAEALRRNWRVSCRASSCYPAEGRGATEKGTPHLRFHAPSAAERRALPAALRSTPAIADATGIVNIHSGRYMEVNHASTANGGKVDQYHYVLGADNEKWYVIADPVGGVTFFNLLNKHSGKCLDTTGNLANGTQQYQWTCQSGNHNQQFYLYGVSCAGVCFTIHPPDARSKCVEVYHSSLSDLAKVDMWDCNGTQTQTWQYP